MLRKYINKINFFNIFSYIIKYRPKNFIIIDKIQMGKKIIPIFIVFAIIISGCETIKTPERTVNCPPPPSQNCKPLVWHGLEVDTSASYRATADKYYIFSPVNSLNTPENEWGLSFIDATHAFLTFDDVGSQSMMVTRFTTDTKAFVESGVGTPFEGGNGAISVRGKNVVVAASSKPEDPSEFIGNSNLYTGVLQGNMIKNTKYMGDKVHKDNWSWESQPTMSKDGNLVFFASDRNLLSGTDIFFTVKLPDGSWSEPVSAGKSVNTDCEELTPFLTDDGKELYFSSCGHETVGGYDIFVSEISNDFWDAVASKDMDKIRMATKYIGKAKNLRPPLNTSADELFPSSPEDPNHILFYISNQGAEKNTSILFRHGGFDIYRRRLIEGRVKNIVNKNMDVNININSPEVINKMDDPNIEFPKTYTLSGTVFNKKTNEPVPNAEVIIRQIDGDPPTIKRENYVEKEREIIISSQGGDKVYDNFKITADEKGDYTVELEKNRTYEVTAQKKDMFFDSFKTRVDEEDLRTEVKHDLFVPPALTLRINFPVDEYSRPYKYVLDSNGIETNQTWKESIDLLAKNLIKSKDIVDSLILIGHTDDQGSDSYNYKLGLNRVLFIIEQLVKRGVPRSMLKGISVGESEPLVQMSGESKRMWRMRCRRVELKKVLKK